MRDEFDLSSPAYTPVKLINETARILRCITDSALARALEVDIAMICRVRHRKWPITARLMVQIADRTGWTVQHIRALGGCQFDGPVVLAVPAQSVSASFVLERGRNLAACCNRRSGPVPHKRWNRIVLSIAAYTAEPTGVTA